MNYQEAKLQKEQLEQNCQNASAAIHAKREELAKRLNIAIPVNAIGLTNDSIKFHPEYRAAKQLYEIAHKQLGNYNRRFLKDFKNEYNEDRQMQRQQKLDSIAR